MDATNRGEMAIIAGGISPTVDYDRQIFFLATTNEITKVLVLSIDILDLQKKRTKGFSKIISKTADLVIRFV